MENVISTDCGDYHFEPVSLFHGRKQIDRNIARENLLILRDILIKTEIKWGLVFGTLLGAIREEDFIEHDEDTDIYILEEDKPKLINSLHELRKYGFEVARYDESILSIIRKNEYIDFYFFKKGLWGRRAGCYYIPRKYFNTTQTIQFFQKDFPTLNKPRDYLTYTYGADWHIPKINSHAEATPILWKKVLKTVFPGLIKLYRLWGAR